MVITKKKIRSLIKYSTFADVDDDAVVSGSVFGKGSRVLKPELPFPTANPESYKNSKRSWFLQKHKIFNSISQKLV